MKSAEFFYDGIFPSLLMSLMMGISPIFISNTGEKRKLYTNKYLYSVNIAYIIFFSTMVLHTVSETRSNVMSNNYYKENKVSNVGIAFIFTGGIFYVYVIYIGGFLKTESIKSSIERLYRVDQVLDRFLQDFKYGKVIFYQIAVQSASLVLICIITAMQRENIHREHFRELSNATWIVFIFPAVSVNIYQNQFAFTILLIKQRFEMINRQLSSLASGLPQSSAPENKSSEAKRSAILNKISVLMKLHDEVCDITRVVNLNYTAQVIVNLAFEYGIILFSVFYIYWMFTLKPFSSICWMMWSTLKLSEILHVTISCHLMSMQANRTKAETHKLLMVQWPSEIEKQLMYFSNQLLHRKVHITVWGILTIDATLLFTMIGAGATYMAIMLQFQQASIPLTCKLNQTTNATM